MFPYARQIIRSIGKRNFHISKSNSIFYEPPDKDGYLKKSEEQKLWEQKPYKERVLLEIQLIRECVKEYVKEFINEIKRGPRVAIYEQELDIIWKFTGDKKQLNEWVITTDKDNDNGFSTAQMDLTQDSKGIFHGFLDTKVPSDGEIKTSGYCNFKLVSHLTPFKNRKTYNWMGFTHLVFRMRGDGRIYTVNLHLQKYGDLTQYDTQHYFIWTRGGPYWQQVRIPFSKFFFGYKGRLQAWNDNLKLDEVESISITVADKITGPFQFEIDYIGVEYDPSYIEETAYESYDHFVKLL